jgi:hypothetical protein
MVVHFVVVDVVLGLAYPLSGAHPGDDLGSWMGLG